MLKFLVQSLAFVLFVALAPVASAQSQPAPAPASAPAPGQASHTGRNRCAPLADRALPGHAAVPGADGVDLSPRGRPGQRWAKESKALKDDALKAVAEKQGWDESVVARGDPDSTRHDDRQARLDPNLGDAMFAQQTDVMDAIQRLREKAEANDKLKTTKQQKVTKKSGARAIVIEPTDPHTIYVPYYDPAVVYGSWPYPSYPPYYLGAGYWPGGGALLATGLAFGRATRLGVGPAAEAIGAATSIGLTTTSTSIGQAVGKLGPQRRSPARRALQQQRRR